MNTQHMRKAWGKMMQKDGIYVIVHAYGIDIIMVQN